MKIRYEIAEFIAHKVAQGLTPHSVHLCEQALTALLGHILDEPGDSLTPERMIELGGELRKRPSPRTGKPLAEGTLRNYLGAGRLFIRWRTLRRMPPGPPGPEPRPSAEVDAEAERRRRPAHHAGELARRLRETEGLERSEMTAQTGLTATEIRALEIGLDSAPKTWRALLGHPAMEGLPEMAQQAGITLPIADKGKRAKRRPANVAETIGLYLDVLHERGNRDSSLLTSARMLRSFFRPVLREPLASLYPEGARRLAEGLPHRVGIHTRKLLGEKTCRAYLDQARAFLAWCARQKRLPGNPLDPSDEDAEQVEREQRPAEPPGQGGKR